MTGYGKEEIVTLRRIENHVFGEVVENFIDPTDAASLGDELSGLLPRAGFDVPSGEALQGISLERQALAVVMLRLYGDRRLGMRFGTRGGWARVVESMSRLCAAVVRRPIFSTRTTEPTCWASRC